MTAQLTPRWSMDCTCRFPSRCDSCRAIDDVQGMAIEMAEWIIDRDPGSGMAARLQEIADR